jgi:hypothetical protein
VEEDGHTFLRSFTYFAVLFVHLGALGAALALHILEASFTAGFTFLAKHFHLPGRHVCLFQFPVMKLLVCCSFSFPNLALRWSRSVVHDRVRSRSAIPASSPRDALGVSNSDSFPEPTVARCLRRCRASPLDVACCTSLPGLLRLGLRIPSPSPPHLPAKTSAPVSARAVEAPAGGPSSPLESAPLRAAISSSFFVDALAVMA